MIKSETIEGLNSPRTLDRLAAARLLVAEAGVDNLPLIHERLMSESEGFVREAFHRVLEHLGTADDVDESDSPEENPAALTTSEIRTQAIEHTAKLFLHELRPILGSVAMHASRDLDTAYATSQTAKRMQRALDVLAVIGRLADASSVPRHRELDLTEVINRVVADDIGNGAVPVLLGRSDVALAVGDPDLLQIALGNVLRNAIEATEEVLAAGMNSHVPVVVNWGDTDSDTWITVLDEGKGLPRGYHQAAEPGTTTKSKSLHLGWGLTIAKQAVSTMHGSLDLVPRGDRGTSCNLRWPAATYDSDANPCRRGRGLCHRRSSDPVARR